MTTDTSIYEYARQGLERSRDKLALWFYGKGMTYSALFSAIDNVADNLSALGVKQGSVVTIHLPNSPQAVMAFYAVAKLGGVCDMAHPLIPIEALASDMNFTGSRVLITGGQVDCRGAEHFAELVIQADMSFHMSAAYRLAYRLKGRTVHRGAKTIPFERLEAAASPVNAPKPGSLAENPAAYLHSSGTTGNPKTVVHSHRALNSWVESSIDFFKGKRLENQRLLAVLPVFHGSGLVLDMHQILCGGGELDIISQFQPKLALHFLKKRKITHMTGVPALYRRMLQLPGFCAKKLPALRECYVSGDRTGPELRREFAGRFGAQAALYEGYGMTETVTACCSNGLYHCKPDSSGYPLKGCAAAVLDGTGRVLPEGEGELLLSTNSMMMGYLKDPEATCAAFLTHGGRQWLRTGDWGRIDADGYVYFLERIKHTIIRKGYNIFPGQVEDAVCTVPEVMEACAVGMPDGDTGTQMVCVWVVLARESDRQKAEKAIRAACGRLLPPYAWPKEIRFLDKLPRNSMSKIDRTRLKE